MTALGGPAALLQRDLGRVIRSRGVRPWLALARPLVGRIAKNCLYTKQQILASVPASLALNLTFLHTPPWETEPWATILEKNNPGDTRTDAPLLIIQGDADQIVAREITAWLVDQAVR